MPRVKQPSKRKRGTTTVPVLGAAGFSLLAGGASAVTNGPAADLPTTPNTLPGQQVTIGDEELSDVSLSTFYVFDKENAGNLGPNIQLARGGCRGCGGRGCRGCARGCGRGCGGCGCWCLSSGGCRIC